MEQEASKVQKKLGEQQVKAAEALISKSAASLAVARALVEKENWQFIAAVVREPVETAMKALEAVDAECQKVLADGGGRVNADVKTVAVQVANLKKSTALAQCMLATMAKASR